jgi:NAD(P)-dependent dehydrogenase (short-subunit alcohol dehydrogenase family)
MGQFDGKVALVTGGNAGLGAAAALQFAQQGAAVAIVARRAEQGQAMVGRLEALGGKALYLQADVARGAEIEAAVQATLDRFGRLDYAVNNAGIAGPVNRPVAQIDEAHWDQVMGVNLKGVFLGMKYQIPAILKQGGGAIVNVSSIYGLKPSDIGHAAYCASKFGVVGLTRTAAIDYAQAGLRVNAVAPGLTRSEMVDPDRPGSAERYRQMLPRHSAMARLGEADEVGKAVVWLCSDAASFVNGAVLRIDGGETTRMY